MTDRVKMAFEPDILVLPLNAILPLRQIRPAVLESVKYKRIATSIAEVGIVEPLVVALPKTPGSGYMLLDGHLRRAALLDLGVSEARCIVANDDEAFTYNKRVNRLATVQEHYMIVRALERGVSEEKLARALNVNIAHIKQRQKMLDRICQEVIELLKDKPVNPATFNELRKMKPARQIEAAELMGTAGNFTANYAKALLIATPSHDLVDPDRPKKAGGMTPDEMAQMQREMENLQRHFKATEATYGDDVLNLVIATGYVAKLVGNPAIERYLERYHPEIVLEFRSIIAAASLNQASAAA